VTNLLKEQHAAAVKSCVLLKKRLPKEPCVRADYTGFEIPDEFVVGYGLDYNGYYRNLPDIAVLRAHVFKG
jgi:hypoxanthine phosphoribosyltransferase